MADGGDKKKGSTRGGGSQRKVSKSGKRYFKNPWIDEKVKESGFGCSLHRGPLTLIVLLLPMNFVDT